MIVSFHPIFQGDTNIICAGRNPGPEDAAAMQTAEAVILPQGCRRALYQLARRNCALVFPNYDARFDYPDKIGQLRLFQKQNFPFPPSKSFSDLDSFHRYRAQGIDNGPFEFPFVFKFNWGGEGETVHLISSTQQFEKIIEIAGDFEQTGQRGFIIQAFIPNGGRALRVTVIGKTLISYWRVQKDSNVFAASLAKGAYLDMESDPELRARAVAAVQRFCQETKINLAGFDLLFPTESNDAKPYLLEINYFFGRRGIGGSERYYAILNKEIGNWLVRHGKRTTSRAATKAHQKDR